MKKWLFSKLFIVLTINVLGQGLHEIRVESFIKLKDDPTALQNKVLSEKGKPCALIKVNTFLDSLEFDANYTIPKVVKKEKGYWVYVSPGESRIQILKEDYLPLEYHLDSEYNLSSYQVYSLSITTNARFPIILKKEPGDARVVFDGKRINSKSRVDTVKEVTLGKHTVSLKKTGYIPLEDTIWIKENQRIFSFRLDKLGKICIHTSPGEAKVLIDKEKVGHTNDCFYRKPGKYHLTLKKKNYRTIDTTIMVDNTTDQLYHINMVYNRGIVQIKSNVTDPLIFINEEKVYSSEKELPIKNHRITVSKEGYHSQSKWVKPERDAKININFNLEPKIADLAFNVHPEDAHVELFKDEQLIKEWDGSRTLENLQVGTYRIQVNKQY